MLTLTRATFALRLACISGTAANWCEDTLYPFGDELNNLENPDTVRRFIKEMRDRLDSLEKEL